MTRSLRVAAVQLDAHDRADFEPAFAHVLAQLDAAAARSDLVVAPEGTIPAYVLGDDAIDAAQTERALDRLSELAKTRHCVVVAGCAIPHGERALNAAVVFDVDGRRAGHAEKLFLWDFDRRWFDAGRRIDPIRTAIGTLGVMICADGRIPTIARGLVDRGAEILVVPTAWVTSGRNPNALENAQADLIARVRAYENDVPLIAANKCGAEAGCVAYCGKSQIVDATGALLAIAAEREAQCIAAELRVARPHPHRARLPAPPMRGPARAARLALSILPLQRGDAGRLELLGAAGAIVPDDPAALDAIDAIVPTLAVDDSTMLDPGSLVAYRQAGYALAVWTTTGASGWAERIARTRALELRMYVAVLDRAAERAYAVDPEGTVVAGTFGPLRLASFTLDPSRVAQTQVAPGSDVLAGLRGADAALAASVRA